MRWIHSDANEMFCMQWKTLPLYSFSFLLHNNTLANVWQSKGLCLSREMEKGRPVQVCWVRRLLFSNGITVNQSWKLIHSVITDLCFLMRKQSDFQTWVSSHLDQAGLSEPFSCTWSLDRSISIPWLCSSAALSLQRCISLLYKLTTCSWLLFSFYWLIFLYIHP